MLEKPGCLAIVVLRDSSLRFGPLREGPPLGTSTTLGKDDYQEVESLSPRRSVSVTATVPPASQTSIKMRPDSFQG
jgi:hypothetical protein